jgi:hypothetical protein
MQVSAMRQTMLANSDRLDEALLSNAFAWVKKCHEDGFDTMAQLIQKVLQLYAAIQLKGEDTEGVAGIVNEVLYADEKQWGSILAVGPAGSACACPPAARLTSSFC